MADDMIEIGRKLQDDMARSMLEQIERDWTRWAELAEEYKAIAPVLEQCP